MIHEAEDEHENENETHQNRSPAYVPNPHMEIHLFRQDLQDYQDFFDLVYLSCSSCQKNKILFRLVSFSSGLDARGQRRRSYETLNPMPFNDVGDGVYPLPKDHFYCAEILKRLLNASGRG
jgi:hypothetical protein